MLPRMMRKDPNSTWPNILGELNSFAFFARQEAILQHKVLRITFEVNTTPPDKIYIESEEKDAEKPDKKVYKLYKSSSFETTYKLPNSVRINAVYQNGKEQLDENKGKFAYCYVVPDGIMQDVLVRMVRTTDKDEDKASFKIRPFLGNFELFETWIKPEKS